MYTRKQHIIRKAIITLVTFTGGVISTVIASAIYDASIQSRATTILATIDSNASTMDPIDVVSYYTLVHMNIESLMQVLSVVDNTLTEKLSIASKLDGTGTATQITSTGITNTGTVNIDTPAIVANTATINKKSCKLIKKESVFEGDSGYGLEGVDLSYAVSEHLGRFSDGQHDDDYYAVPDGQTVDTNRVSGKELYSNNFRCNDGIFQKSSTADLYYGPMFCNDPGYVIDGFTVEKMLKKSGSQDLNGGYQYFKMNVGDTYRQAYAKCDPTGKIVVLEKKEYPKSWNCERGGVVDGITVPKFIRPAYSGYAANDSYGFLDSYFLDGQSSETLKTSSQDGYAYDIKVRCDKGVITITDKVQGELDDAHKAVLLEEQYTCKAKTIEGYVLPETKHDTNLSISKEMGGETYTAEFQCRKGSFSMTAYSCAPTVVNGYSVPVVDANRSKTVYKKVGNDVHHAEVECRKEMISSGNWTDYKVILTRDKGITTTVCDAGQIDGFSYPFLDGSMEVQKPIGNDYLYATVSCSNGKTTLSRPSCAPTSIGDFDIPGIREGAFIELSNKSKTLTAQVICEHAWSGPRASALFTYGTRKRVYAVSQKQKEFKNTLCSNGYETLMADMKPLSHNDDYLFIPIHNPDLDGPDYRTSWWGYVHNGEIVDLIRCN